MAPPAQYNSLEMTERLIGFDTTSRLSNLELIGFVEDYLRGYGIEAERVVSEDGRKANLWATLGDKNRAGGIILSGHSDVVPVEGQSWNTPPFQATVRDNRLYGRGSCDMKSFIAIALAMVPDFLERPLSAPIHFAISYDEEVGCLGVRPLLKHIREKLPMSAMPPALAIIGEPTSMRVVNAHKSIHVHETLIEGLEAHSSATHKGVSSIIAAGKLINFLDGISAEMRQRSDDDTSKRFDPPYTSVQIGVIEGGEAVNIIPRHCRFDWEYRSVPGSDDGEIFDRFNNYAKENLLPDMQRVASHASIETRKIASVPAFSVKNNSEAEALALRLSGSNHSLAVSYASEAGLFEGAGIPAVVCGPGNILQAHRPDEFIDLSQIKECENFLRKLLEHLRA